MLGPQEAATHRERLAIERLRRGEVPSGLHRVADRGERRGHVGVPRSLHAADDLERLAVERLGRLPVPALSEHHAEVVDRRGDLRAVGPAPPLAVEDLAVKHLRLVETPQVLQRGGELRAGGEGHIGVLVADAVEGGDRLPIESLRGREVPPVQEDARQDLASLSHVPAVRAVPLQAPLERGADEALRRVEQSQALVGLAQGQLQRGLDLGLASELLLQPLGRAVEEGGDGDLLARGARVGGAQHPLEKGVHLLRLGRGRPGPVPLRFRDARLAPDGEEPDDHRGDERQAQHRRHREGGPVLPDPAADELPGRVAVGAHQLTRQEPAQVLRELARGRVPPGGLELHRFLDDRREVGWGVGLTLGHRPRPLRGRRGEHLLDRGAGARGRSREQVVEHRAQRVDVGPLVDRLAPGLLRRHVGGRAEHRARDRVLSTAPRAHGGGGRVVGRRRRRQVLRQAPVHDHGLAEAAHQDVGRLEVAVDDVLAVRVGHGLGHGQEVGQQGEPAREATLRRADERVERPAGDELHGVEGHAVRPSARLVDGDDRRVLEPRGDERLPHEAPGARGGRGLELLQGDRAAQPPVARGKDAAHAAARELALDRVVLAADDRQP